MVSATGGENPSVYFVWGDNDAGTDYTDLANWDNQVAMGTLGAGSFSTNLSGLQTGKVYYFRTAASNGSGSLVSNALGIFSVSNLGGQTAQFSSLHTGNRKLWLDANYSSSLWQDSGASSAAANSNTVALWQDRSGNSNHFTQGTAGGPTHGCGHRIKQHAHFDF
jgi:hypothetical protein